LGWLENKVGLKGEDQRPNPSGDRADGIEIVTWHASKGREWPVVVVSGLDHKHDPRPGTFTTDFPNFDDLNHVIDEASLAYAPKFAAPEATNRFLYGLHNESTETAKRLLYVALTRARNRLIIEWPQEDGKVDVPSPITARHLLSDVCGIKIEGNQINIDGATFSTRVTVCTKYKPESFDTVANDEQKTNQRVPRNAIEKRSLGKQAPVVSPSHAHSTDRPLPNQLDTSKIAQGISLSSSELKQATDKGTAVHEALRILLCRPELTHRALEHCRVEQTELDILAEQARALRQSLADRGFAKLHVEQPIEIALPDGGIQTVILDLIAEGPDGFIIIDHKSGAVTDHAHRFESYWPQLAAYADVVEEKSPNPVCGVAIFWTDTGELTYGNLS
jgi:ATP-dependent exoDNAse (exonuclease V) beta subunit